MELKHRTTTAKSSNGKGSTLKEIEPEEKIAQSTAASPRSFLNVDESGWKMALYLLLFTVVFRAFYIHHPPVTVHEEVKYGNQILSYQKGEFFLDSNPPLGSLVLYGISRFVAGEFPLKMKFKEAGESFLLENAPYSSMRFICMFVGALIPSMLLIVCLMMGMTRQVSCMVASLAVFETAFATSLRLMTVDSFFLVFNLCSFIGLFCMMREKTFELKWFACLFSCSVATACSVSTKASGKYTFGFACAIFAADWWQRCFKDRSKRIFPHLLGDVTVKIAVLSTVTWLVYSSSFMVHLELLQSGPEAPNSLPLISPRFKASFHNDSLVECPEILHYGARIVMKPYTDSNFYLHSHPNLYPKGSSQQQVTGYEFHDENNIWIVRKATSSDPEVKRRKVVKTVDGKEVEQEEFYTEVQRENEADVLESVKHGDIIRLEHEVTGRFLHSHHIEPPSSNKDHHCEVSGYGGLRYLAGDDNDDWKIEIMNDEGDLVGKEGEPVKCQSLFVRLVHTRVGCMLQSNKKNLPDWGYFQREITCGKFSKKYAGVWTIVANDHPKYEETIQKARIKPKSTWEKYRELVKCMKLNFKDLTKSTTVPSQPLTWPSPRGANGIQLWNFAESLTVEGNIYDARLKKSQIYLVPNLVNQIACLVAIVAFFAIGLAKWLMFLRGEEFLPQLNGLFTLKSGAIVLGWMFHWIPFIFNDSSVNFTDYFTAYLFSIVLLGQLAQHSIETLKHSARVYAFIVGMSALFYLAYSPLILGTGMSVGYCEKLSSVNSKWRFICE